MASYARPSSPENFEWARSVNDENYNETVFKPIVAPNMRVAIR